MSPRRRTPLPPLAAIALAALAFAVSACGESEHPTEVVEGQPVTLGELKYNVTFSRFLNPYDTQDSAFLVGQRPPPADSTYFGVFLEIQNEDDRPHTLPETVTVATADHERFEALPSESLYALPFGEEVAAEEQVPVLDSTAQQGAIEGSLVLFLLPYAATENRPLTLSIPGEGGPATVTLDL